MQISVIQYNKKSINKIQNIQKKQQNYMNKLFQPLSPSIAKYIDPICSSPKCMGSPELYIVNNSAELTKTQSQASQSISMFDLGPINLHKAKAICLCCEQEEASLECGLCDKKQYCSTCSQIIHSGPKFKAHAPTPLQPNRLATPTLMSPKNKTTHKSINLHVKTSNVQASKINMRNCITGKQISTSLKSKKKQLYANPFFDTKQLEDQTTNVIRIQAYMNNILNEVYQIYRKWDNIQLCIIREVDNLNRMFQEVQVNLLRDVAAKKNEQISIVTKVIHNKLTCKIQNMSIQSLTQEIKNLTPQILSNQQKIRQLIQEIDVDEHQKLKAGNRISIYQSSFPTLSDDQNHSGTKVKNIGYNNLINTQIYVSSIKEYVGQAIASLQRMELRNIIGRCLNKFQQTILCEKQQNIVQPLKTCKSTSIKYSLGLTPTLNLNSTISKLNTTTQRNKPPTTSSFIVLNGAGNCNTGSIKLRSNRKLNMFGQKPADASLGSIIDDHVNINSYIRKVQVKKVKSECSIPPEVIEEQISKCANNSRGTPNYANQPQLYRADKKIGNQNNVSSHRVQLLSTKNK